MNTLLSKLACVSVGAVLLSATPSVLADDITGFAGARGGWMHLDSQRTETIDESEFNIRDGLRTFAPGIELGFVVAEELAFRAYYDHLSAEYRNTNRTARGYSSGVDMLFGFSEGFYGGVGVNHTDLGDQRAFGLRLTGGHRYNFTDRISSRIELAYQATTQRGFDDIHATAILQYTFGQKRALQAIPEPYATQAASVEIPDADGDGVPDYLDLCPGTPAEHAVNEYGCSQYQARDRRFEINVTFALNSADIQDEFLQEISVFAEHLRQNPDQMLRIEGHTDSSGRGWRNRQLSQERADAVKSVLVDDFGIDASRIKTQGYADTRPLNYGDKENPANRRVEAIFEVEQNEAVRR